MEMISNATTNSRSNIDEELLYLEPNIPFPRITDFISDTYLIISFSIHNSNERNMKWKTIRSSCIALSIKCSHLDHNLDCEIPGPLNSDQIEHIFQLAKTEVWNFCNAFKKLNIKIQSGIKQFQIMSINLDEIDQTEIRAKANTLEKDTLKALWTYLSSNAITMTITITDLTSERCKSFFRYRFIVEIAEPLHRH